MLDENAIIETSATAIPLTPAQRRLLLTLRGALRAVLRLIDALLTN